MTAMIPTTMQKLAVPVDGLKPYGRNPRKGDVDAIKASLERHGQYKALVVRAGTNEVLAGNHTLQAALQLGWKEIAVTFVDVDDDDAARIVLVDNRAADKGGYDEDVLADLLGSLPEPAEGTGYDTAALDAVLHRAERSNLPAGEGGEKPSFEPAATAERHTDQLRFGALIFPMEQDEIDDFGAAVKEYVAQTGTHFGFFMWVLDGRPSKS